MKKMLLTALFITASFGAQASNLDTYKCYGNNASLSVVVDWYGQGLKQTVNGTVMGKKISYAAIPDYHPRKLDPEYKYTFLQDPNSDVLVRMVNPDLSGLPDGYYTAFLTIGGKNIALTCENPRAAY